MQNQLKSVKKFHQAFGVKISNKPTLELSKEILKLRHSLMQEENNEYLKAVEEKNLIEVADALGDMLYILCGTILTHGFQNLIEDIFDEIQAPCEESCVLGIINPPVSIEMIEKYIVERGFKEGWIKAIPPKKRTNKSIAIIGSGPAGLAAAQQLNRAGHYVTVFERDEKIGGLLRYGIPDFKMEKNIIDRRVKILKDEELSSKLT